MYCEWRHNCEKPATRHLTIEYLDYGDRNSHYFCEAHALMRISELEDEPDVELVGSGKTVTER